MNGMNGMNGMNNMGGMNVAMGSQPGMNGMGPPYSNMNAMQPHHQPMAGYPNAMHHQQHAMQRDLNGISYTKDGRKYTYDHAGTRP
jgi:hypothetical protein